MFEYKLKYPVYTHDGEILFPFGMSLTEEILKDHIKNDKTALHGL